MHWRPTVSSFTTGTSSYTGDPAPESRCMLGRETLLTGYPLYDHTVVPVSARVWLSPL